MRVSKEVICDVFPSLKNLELDSYNIAIDSRMVSADSIFFAIVGENNDGHDFIENAIKAGARICIVSKKVESNLDCNYVVVDDTTKAFGDLARTFWLANKKPLVAITGSCGKTTTTQMVKNILEEKYNVLSPSKNFNNEYGVPLTVFSMTDKTEFAALEYATRNPGDIGYLANICSPDISLITNIAPCHIERFEDLDAIANEKSYIYREMNLEGTAIVNADDVYAPFFISNISAKKIITFGIENLADVSCKEIKTFSSKLEVDVISPVGEFTVMLPCVGIHNVMNALAAIAVAISCSIPVPLIIKGLSRFENKEHRWATIAGVNNSIIIDDSYNSNPLAMQSALSTLESLPIEKKVVVMGDMAELGIHSKSMHELIGVQAKSLGINSFLGIGEFSKYSCMAFGSGAKHFRDKNELISYLEAMADDKTIILVKGSRSMKLEDIVSSLSVEDTITEEGGL